MRLKPKSASCGEAVGVKPVICSTASQTNSVREGRLGARASGRRSAATRRIASCRASVRRSACSAGSFSAFTRAFSSSSRCW